MNYLRKAFNLYQLSHRIDASATDIKELDEDNDDEEEEGSKNADSTRSAATKARATDMFTITGGMTLRLILGRMRRFGKVWALRLDSI